MPSPRLTAEHLATLNRVAPELGIAKVGVVALDHPGFELANAALDHHVEQQRFGEMAFMAKTVAVRKDPTAMLGSARSAVVAVVPYTGEAGSIARYAQAEDYHRQIHRRLDALVERLKAMLPGIETLVCVDTKPVQERAMAVLAGLGFLGKHGCLIVPGLGSYVLIGVVLCSMAWEEHQPFEEHPWQACGHCTQCIDACPTDALIEAGVLDATQCISYLTIEHRGAIEPSLMDRMGHWVAGCDICQAVCPYNASPARTERAPAEAWLEPWNDRPPSDLATLATIGSSRYRAFVRGTALQRIPRRALRRNALIAMGNLDSPLSASERDAASKAKDDVDPQVAAAAARVLERRDR